MTDDLGIRRDLNLVLWCLVVIVIVLTTGTIKTGDDIIAIRAAVERAVATQPQ